MIIYFFPHGIHLNSWNRRDAVREMKIPCKARAKRAGSIRAIDVTARVSDDVSTRMGQLSLPLVGPSGTDFLQPPPGPLLLWLAFRIEVSLSLLKVIEGSLNKLEKVPQQRKRPAYVVIQFSWTLAARRVRWNKLWSTNKCTERCSKQSEKWMFYSAREAQVDRERTDSYCIWVLEFWGDSSCL